MFTTKNAPKILFIPIGTLLALCLTLIMGCNGGAHKACLQSLEVARVERAKALQRAKMAESKLDTALDDIETTMSERDTAKSAKKIAESERAKALQRAKMAESKLDTALDDIETATSERDAAESKLDTALANLEIATSERDTAKSAKKIAESERDAALKRAKTAEELVNLVPQATITNVRVAEKKKDIDIFVTFNIKNRKGSKGSVKVSFHFANGRPLRNKNGPISISEEFTPKGVNENRTVKLSMSYAELNIAQPANLQFRFRIYDKSTENFLDGKPYSKPFSFNPHKN